MIKWLFVFILFFNLNAQPLIENISIPSKLNVCSLTNNAFQSGEKLTYTIYYNWGLLWLAAGEATFSIKENVNNYLYAAIGKSYSSYNWFFKVDDYFYSYVDKKTLLPYRAKRDINEGGYIIHNDIKFYQNEKKAISTVKVNDKEPKLVEKKFDSCMFDILSIIYALRNLDKNEINIGDNIPFSMMLDDDVYPLKLEYLKDTHKKKVKKLGKFNSFMISPSIIKGRVFSQDERMKVWISDDENKIPLVIESPLAIGKIKVVLKSHEGLKYPLLKL